MNPTGAIRRMLAAGLTMDQALIAADAFAAEAKAEADQKAAEKRAVNAIRQRRFREERNANNALQALQRVTGVTQPVAYTEDAPTHAEPEPNKTTSPPTSEANASSVGAPSADLPLTGELLLPIAKPKPPPNSSRGCRLPPGFPGNAEREWTRTNLGFSDDDFDECAAEFRDYWSGVSGRHGVKCDWPATFRNGARKFRPRRGSRQAFAAGNQRSDGSLLGAYQRAAARVRAANDVPRERPGVCDHGSGDLEMHYGIPAE